MKWVRVPDSGWQLLIAQLVAEIAPQLVRTMVDERPHWMVDEECIVDGATTTRRRPITDEERADALEGYNGYLRDAGVPEIPANTAVYLVLPSGVRSMDELCELLLADLGQYGHPRQVAAALREVIPQRYRRELVP